MYLTGGPEFGTLSGMTINRVRTCPGFIAFICLLASLFVSNCRPKTSTLATAPETAPPALIDPWKEAALKVEQDRGEPMGRQAKVEVPDQLKHYEDSRRFLGSQLAEARNKRLQTPADFADVITLVDRGELVELSPLGNAYILYGVGMVASEGPFTHYDKAKDQSVPLFPNDAELQKELNQISESMKTLEKTLTDIKQQIRQAPRRDRELRKRLQSEISENEKSLGSVQRRKKLLDAYYRNAKAREQLFAEFERIASRARDFGGHTYDLNDAVSRKQMKVKLLSYLRPAALKVLEELAQAYQDKFGRPLPITSLIRPDEYQRQLRENNPNATTIDVPPHTTGLAFDVFYRFMTAAEQDFIMSELARMRDAGRIEALRELRNHFHVFAYTEGRPPDEKLIQGSLGQVGPRRETKPAVKKVTRAKTRRRAVRRRR